MLDALNRALELTRELDRDRARLFDRRRANALDRELGHAWARARTKAGQRAAAGERAKGLDLDHQFGDLFGLYLLDNNLGIELNRARALALDLAVALTALRRRRVENGAGDDKVRRADSWLRQAYDVLRFTAEDDLSGQDLSAVDLSILDLTGLVWSDATTWPEGMRDEIRRGSNELRPGVYQVARWLGSVRRDGQ